MKFFSPLLGKEDSEENTELNSFLENLVALSCYGLLILRVTEE